MIRLNYTDIAILVAFMASAGILPFYIGYKKRSHGFLALTFAGRELGFLSIALTMFLSENGTAQLSGMAGWAVRSGLGIYGQILVSSFGLLTLGWLFTPVYMASGILTTIDYVTKRFGGKRIPIIMVLLMLIINTVSKLSVELQTTKMLLKELYPKHYEVINVALLVGGVVGVFPGGLYSLVYTNNLLFLFFMVGMPVVFHYSYDRFRSWQEIRLRYQKSWPTTTIEHVANGIDYKYTECGIPDMHSMAVIRSHNDQDLPWPGMVFGVYIISIYNFCIDQSILQYCLGGKNLVHAKRACILDSFFKVFTIFFVVPGFIARVLFTDTVACADPDVCEEWCGKRSGCSDLALVRLFEDVVPKGWRGIVLAAFMAASLTSIAATLHAGSSIFVINLFRAFRPKSNECECTIVGKIMVLLQAGVGIALVNAVDQIPAIHDFMGEIYASLAPPLVAVYLTAIFWDRLTEKIAFRTLLLGTCIALTRLGVKLSYGFVPCGDEKKLGAPDIIANFHYLHFAIFLFVLCESYMVISGLMTNAINHFYLYRLLFSLRFVKLERIDINIFNQASEKARNDGITSKASNRLTDRFSVKLKLHDDAKLKSLIEGNPTSSFSDEDDEDYDSDDDEEDEVQEEAVAAGNDVEMNKKQEKKRRCCCGKKTKCTSLSLKPLKQEIHSHRRFVRILERETPGEAETLNSLLIILLLVIVFVMGFFTN